MINRSKVSFLMSIVLLSILFIFISGYKPFHKEKVLSLPKDVFEKQLTDLYNRHLRKTEAVENGQVRVSGDIRDCRFQRVVRKDRNQVCPEFDSLLESTYSIDLHFIYADEPRISSNSSLGTRTLVWEFTRDVRELLRNTQIEEEAILGKARNRLGWGPQASLAASEINRSRFGEIYQIANHEYLYCSGGIDTSLPFSASLRFMFESSAPVEEFRDLLYSYVVTHCQTE